MPKTTGTGSTKRSEIHLPGTREGFSELAKRMEGWVSPIGDFPLWLEQQVASLQNLQRNLSDTELREFDSLAWYLQELLNRARIIKARIAAGDLKGAMGFVMEFGFFSREMQMKFPADKAMNERDLLTANEDRRIVNATAALSARKLQWQSEVDDALAGYKESVSENFSKAAAFVIRTKAWDTSRKRSVCDYLRRSPKWGLFR